MNKTRIEALSDGVFAIVMTLLVIDIKVPTFATEVSDSEIWAEIYHLLPIFGSYVLSFAVLTMYWVSHQFLITYMAKNIDRNLSYINMFVPTQPNLLPY